MKQNTPLMDIIEMIDDMISDRKERVESIVDLRIVRNLCTVKLEQEKKMVVNSHTAGETKAINVIKTIFPELDFTPVDIEIEKIAKGIEPDESANQYYTTKYNQLK